jgi:hypothetical protein
MSLTVQLEGKVGGASALVTFIVFSLLCTRKSHDEHAIFYKLYTLR